MLINYQDGESQLLNLAIRDTTAHPSSSNDIRGYVRKALYINNDLNQSVSIQIQGCFKDSTTAADWVNIGTAQTVNADTKAIIGEKEIDTLKNYFPYIRVTATCSTAPNADSLTVNLMVG